MSSDTPRTDSQIISGFTIADRYTSWELPEASFVPTHFARKLEREIAIAKDDYGVAQHEQEQLRADLARVTAERDQLQEFKDYVHTRLNMAGVPVDPESPHKAYGCRIGGRLDALFAERDEYTRDAERYRRLRQESVHIEGDVTGEYGSETIIVRSHEFLDAFVDDCKQHAKNLLP